MTPDGMRAQIDLTITDDFPLAQAIVIISAVPSIGDSVMTAHENRKAAKPGKKCVPRECENIHLGGDYCRAHQVFAVSAVQHSVKLNEADMLSVIFSL